MIFRYWRIITDTELHKESSYYMLLFIVIIARQNTEQLIKVWTGQGFQPFKFTCVMAVIITYTAEIVGTILAPKEIDSHSVIT